MFLSQCSPTGCLPLWLILFTVSYFTESTESTGGRLLQQQLLFTVSYFTESTGGRLLQQQLLSTVSYFTESTGGRLLHQQQ